MPSFSTTLEQAIHAALGLANKRSHEVATLEHLLLALMDEQDAARVLRACDVDTEELRETLVEFLETDLASLVTEVEGSEAVPTAAFQRVIQRAAIHVQSSGRTEVTGANVLVAIFAGLFIVLNKKKPAQVPVGAPASAVFQSNAHQSNATPCFSCRQPILSMMQGCPSCGARYHAVCNVPNCVNCGAESSTFVNVES